MNLFFAWQYLIFLLPLGLAGLLLVLSTLRGGGRRGGGGGARGPAARAGGSSGVACTTTSGGAMARGGSVPKGGGTRAAAAERGGVGDGGQNLFAVVLGTHKAPASLVGSVYCLCWGLCGYWANRLLNIGADTNLFQISIRVTT